MLTMPQKFVMITLRKLAENFRAVARHYFGYPQNKHGPGRHPVFKPDMISLPEPETH